MYKILEKQKLASTVTLLKLQAPEIAKKVKPGQFVIIRLNEEGERVPLTVNDFDRERGTITIVFQEVGKTTKLWAGLTPMKASPMSLARWAGIRKSRNSGR